MEHLAGVMPRVACVIVTTPQAVALTDAQKSVSFARAVQLRILGLIENMSGYVCPCCGELSRVFSMGGGADMAQREGVCFLGSVPVDTALVGVLDGGKVLEGYGATTSSRLFVGIVEKLIT
jgi:Mrp family chromosome partitioning ATPase